MRTAYSETPVSQFVKVVDKSRSVNSDSRIGAALVNGFVNSSRIAKSGSTAGESTLPEGAADWFAVTRNDGSMAMIPPVPAPTPVLPPFIPTTLRDGVWVPTEYIQ